MRFRTDHQSIQPSVKQQIQHANKHRYQQAQLFLSEFPLLHTNQEKSQRWPKQSPQMPLLYKDMSKQLLKTIEIVHGDRLSTDGII